MKRRDDQGQPAPVFKDTALIQPAHDASTAPEATPDLKRFHRELARRVAIASAALVLVIVPVYQLADGFGASSSPMLWTHAYWRTPPIILAVVILTWCQLRQDGSGAIWLVRLLGLSVMVMMFGLFASNFIDPAGDPQRMVSGLIMTTFAVALIALRGFRELLILYSLPMAGLITYLAVAGADLTAAIGMLFDSVMMLAVGLVASEMLFRTRLQAWFSRQKLHIYASTDPLTGLGNRRLMVPQLDGEVSRARRHGNALSVLMADLDYFKRVNDNHGHDAGDAVLREFAGRLRRLLRREDRAARWGGEEFLILLTETGSDEARTVAEKIRRATADQPFEVNGVSLTITVSIGVATHTCDDDTDALIKRADIALYEAKQSGRNRVCVDRG